MRAVRYNVDGNYCVTCGQDKSVKLWNPDRKALLKSYTGHGYEVLFKLILTLSFYVTTVSISGARCERILRQQPIGLLRNGQDRHRVGR